MKSLLVVLLVAYPNVSSAAEPFATENDGHCNERPPVIVVSEGSSGWAGQSAEKIIGDLKSLTGSCHALEVIRFDAEPALQHGFLITGARRDLVVVRPRTPMKDTMEVAFAGLMHSPTPHTMVVIAHEEFYPSSVSKGRLLELAHHSETTVHTIHLSSRRERIGAFRRLVRSLRNGAVWVVGRVGLEVRGYSARDTARLLESMAGATGGTACAIGEQQTSADCATIIAAEIVGRYR
jgi:hypothetical protein